VLRCACRFAYEISSALRYLHDSCSIAHLDIKPANVIVCSRDDRCKLIDFGCSIKLPSRSSSSLSSVSAIVADLPSFSSTPHSSSSSTSWSPRLKSAASASRFGYGGTLVYKAPELLKADDVTDDECRRRLHKADIYSFGVFLWQLSSRKLPYSAQYPNASPCAIVYAVVEYDARPDGSGNGPCFRRFESVTPPPSPDALKCGNTGDAFLLSAAGVNENGYEEVYRKCWDVDVEVRPTSAALARQFDAWMRRTPSSGRDVIVRPARMLSIE
jgi:serine/threonine protein kinase